MRVVFAADEVEFDAAAVEAVVELDAAEVLVEVAAEEFEVDEETAVPKQATPPSL